MASWKCCCWIRWSHPSISSKILSLAAGHSRRRSADKFASSARSALNSANVFATLDVFGFDKAAWLKCESHGPRRPRQVTWRMAAKPSMGSNGLNPRDALQPQQPVDLEGWPYLRGCNCRHSRIVRWTLEWISRIQVPNRSAALPCVGGDDSFTPTQRPPACRAKARWTASTTALFPMPGAKPSWLHTTTARRRPRLCRICQTSTERPQKSSGSVGTGCRKGEKPGPGTLRRSTRCCCW
mmetsp:Transcript_35105/g.74684  ORF Transcript_35105/g.74684 Transcript_35105/m.74684 type:complete len:239 (-) Transcript_35105:3120-3836(-)